LNALILTSCNRIEQLLFALAVNKEIIQNEFFLVVADCSTPYMDMDNALKMHNSDDPYNKIGHDNYNSEWGMIRDYVKSTPKIKDFRIVHLNPRLAKQRGEATLILYGILAADLLGADYALKLSGSCLLTQDLVSNLGELVKDNVAVTWKRSAFPQKSTRVFACNPSKLSKVFMEDARKWTSNYTYLEVQFEEYLQGKQVDHLEIKEDDVIVDGGREREKSIFRNRIETHLKTNFINSHDEWISKFWLGNIW